MFKVQVEALDGKVITPRTGRVISIGECEELPAKESNFFVYWLPGETEESPGIWSRIVFVENIDNVYKYVDAVGRRFLVTVLPK